MRKSYGAFKSVDDLLAIKGIGPKRLEKMRKYLTVGKTEQSKKALTHRAGGAGEVAARKSDRDETSGEKQAAPRAIREERRRAVAGC